MGENEIMKSPNDQELRKFLQEKHDPHSQLKKLKSYSNAANLPLFNSVPSPAKFIPDPLQTNVFRAHPVTIRAMRKELFMGGENFVDLECLRICDSCKHEIDLQFWKFCPYCEASIL